MMLLSVSVWSGALDMSQETRDLFHWLSALIALPAVAYAGQPFFQSAWRALKSRSLNMDVPISLGVILALSLSVYETAHHAQHAYFDSAVMLLFFLLCGRTLDHMMRRKTRAVASNLAAMKARGPEAILLNVLDPNREVNPQFLSYALLTLDGRQLTGMITAETATSASISTPVVQRAAAVARTAASREPGSRSIATSR